MKLNRSEIQTHALEILEDSPQGIRWSDLLNAVDSLSDETPRNSVHGAIHNLLTTRTADIIKVTRGTYQLAKYADDENLGRGLSVTGPILIGESNAAELKGPSEQDFYASFATWLEENDEATVASALGGASFGGKWGTPDVIGVFRPRRGDIFQFEPQLITAEIKSVPNQPVVAFGQAVAYRLFSHKSYIVLPNTTTREDMDRLVSLCSIHGVGLVTFALDVENPNYSVVVIPAVATPDMFYVNGMLERLKSSDQKLLHLLFP